MIDAVSNQFNRFVQFAQEKIAAGARTAIATKGDVEVGGGTPLEERKITTTNNGDRVGKFRNQDLKDVNDAVRALFRKTVADMFGGEKNIPASVRKQMLMSDYGKGKPLTARRIMYVKNAIDALHRTNCFSDERLASKAIAAGYQRIDFGKLNTAVNLYVKVKGGSLEHALDEVLTKGSFANRAMNTGSLCMKDEASFRRGIESMEQVAGKDARNGEIAGASGSAGATRNLSEIASNLADKFKKLLDNADKTLAELNPPEEFKDILDEMHGKCTTIANKMSELATQLRKGQLTDREQIFKQLFDMKDVSDLSGMLRGIYNRIKSGAPGNQTLLDFNSNLGVYIRSVNSEYEALRKVYKSAVAADLLPVATGKLNTAVATANQNGKTASIPQKIYDGLGVFLNEAPFVNLQRVDKLCEEIAANGDAKFRFSVEQKQELEGIFKNVLGEGPKADKAFQRFVREFEASFFAEPLLNPDKYKTAKVPRPDYVFAHLKANPEAVKLFEIGFKLDTEDEVKAVKDFIKATMLSDIANPLKNTDPNHITSLASGLMPQTIREYNLGYVKFNGENIPPAPGNYNCKCIYADNPDRRGFVKFLEEKFDDSHKKMRQLVSFSCGMALGLGGTMDNAITNGEPKELVLGMSRIDANNRHNIGAMGGRDHNDVFDISIAENGDVTITKTLYLHNKISQFSAKPEEIASGKDPFFAAKHLDSGVPDAAYTKVTATMTIKNATDAELGDNMPEFTIDSIHQEMLD